MKLDTDEYLHLAIHAVKNQQHHAALEYLHKCLEQDPDNSRAIFLLAAEYAELGLHDRAIQTMSRSIELEPGLEMARYQLGLLQMQSGNMVESLEIWEHLAGHAEDLNIRLVAQGLSIIDTDYAEGLRLVREAAQRPTENAFLNSSINIIYTNLTTANKQAEAATDDSAAAHTLFLGAYKNSRFQQEDE